MTLPSQLKKYIVQNPLPVIRALLEASFPWPESLEAMEPYQRFEDDTMEGSIMVAFSKDGDGWIEISSKPDPNECNRMFRFRTFAGGGQSPRVRAALFFVAEAIRLDNEERPQRRGG